MHRVAWKGINQLGTLFDGIFKLVFFEVNALFLLGERFPHPVVGFRPIEYHKGLIVGIGIEVKGG